MLFTDVLFARFFLWHRAKGQSDAGRAMAMWEQDIQDILFEPAAIGERVAAPGRQITGDYADGADPLVLVGILKGSLFFLTDLARAIARPIEMELMAMSSYGPANGATGVARILKDLDIPITGRNVLIVEGIVDTGLSLHYLLRNLRARRPKSLQVCTFLDKPARRSLNIPIAYRGFEIPDVFVVGYGLDFNQAYRNLPFIGALKDTILQG